MGNPDLDYLEFSTAVDCTTIARAYDHHPILTFCRKPFPNYLRKNKISFLVTLCRFGGLD